ncbi:MAG: hypothetical protein U9N42_05645 [Campylobacterota bacterium]|nr:hypothetical protein [Campylobacterota bacterium]
MYAAEFQTTIHSEYIKIPEYEHFKGREVQIIVLDVEKHKELNKTEEKDFIEHLIDNPVDFPKEFKFDREEANER